MTARLGPCLPGHAFHRFDSTSGWCARSCGWRDDGATTYPATPLPPLELVDITEPRRSTEVEHPALLDRANTYERTTP